MRFPLRFPALFPIKYSRYVKFPFWDLPSCGTCSPILISALVVALKNCSVAIFLQREGFLAKSGLAQANIHNGSSRYCSRSIFWEHNLYQETVTHNKKKQILEIDRYIGQYLGFTDISVSAKIADCIGVSRCWQNAVIFLAHPDNLRKKTQRRKSWQFSCSNASRCGFINKRTR